MSRATRRHKRPLRLLCSGDLRILWLPSPRHPLQASRCWITTFSLWVKTNKQKNPSKTLFLSLLCALGVNLTHQFDHLCSGLGQSVPEKHATALDVPRKQLVFQCALQYGWVHTRICARSRSLSADPPLPGFVQFCRCRTKSPCNLSLRRAAFDLSCLVSHCDPQPRHREAIEPHHVAHNHTALTLQAALFACVATPDLV